ncbi:hypothetical protein Tco_1346180 [Tanacetum coccineum]
MKQVDQYAQSISSIPAIVDRYIGNQLGEAIQKAIQSHNAECKEEALAEKKEYIDLIDTSVTVIIKEEVKTQLPQILPKAFSDFATPVIEQNITESLEVVVLAKSSSQPKSTYEAAASLSEFKVTKILMDKMEERKSYLRADYKRELYDALVKSYNTDKDLFESYGDVYSLKRDRDEKDEDQDPSAGSDRGTKERSQARKMSHPEIQSPRILRNDMDYTDDQPDIEVASKSDWFKKPKEPPTPDPEWNARKTIDFRPPQTWISGIAKAIKPPLIFDELMSTPIDFSAYIMNHLKIDNLTQQHLAGPAFDMLKGTCKSRVELEFHFKECYKAVNDHLDWKNPEVLVDYFINNDLEYLKGGSLSRKYTTSTIKTKAAKYDNIEGIEDMFPTLWSPVKVVCDRYALWGISHWGLK